MFLRTNTFICNLNILKNIRQIFFLKLLKLGLSLAVYKREDISEEIRIHDP